MLHRLRVSLSNPKHVVFFMKDRFSYILLYVLLLLSLLTVPVLLKNAVNPEMDAIRYTAFYDAISKEFKESDAKIINSTLIISDVTHTGAEHFIIYLGEQPLGRMTINLVFGEEDLILYLTNMERQRMSYERLGIVNFDFKQATKADYHRLMSSVKTIIEAESTIKTMDVMIAYGIGFIDFFLIAFLLSFMMAIYPLPYRLTYANRLKMTLYLMTVWVMVELIIRLFDVSALSFLSVFVVYIYHLMAYRFMKTLKVGGSHEKGQV